MSWIETLVFYLVMFAFGIVVGYMVGVEIGWQQRIHYEVLQCADYGRCFR